MTAETITKTDWRIAGKHLGSCNCDWACPCQFSALPTHGNCEALIGYAIETGHFGDTSLNGVTFVEAFYWPGPIHEGNGTRLLILDDASTAKQHAGVTQITDGTQGHPYFEIFATMAPNAREPVVVPIEMEVDVKARRGRLNLPGVGTSTVEPIRHQVTGDEHWVRIDLPNGFEYKQAEIGNSVNWEVTAGDPLDLQNTNSYAQLYEFEWASDGTTRTR